MKRYLYYPTYQNDGFHREGFYARLPTRIGAQLNNFVGTRRSVVNLIHFQRSLSFLRLTPSGEMC